MGRKRFSRSWIISILIQSIGISLGFWFLSSLYFLVFYDSANAVFGEGVSNSLFSQLQIGTTRGVFVYLKIFTVILMAGIFCAIPGFIVGIWDGLSRTKSERMNLEFRSSHLKRPAVFWITLVGTQFLVLVLGLCSSGYLIWAGKIHNDGYVSNFLLKANEIFFFHNEGKRGKKVISDGFGTLSHQKRRLLIYIPEDLAAAIRNSASTWTSSYQWTRIFPRESENVASDLTQLEEMNSPVDENRDGLAKDLLLRSYGKLRNLHFLLRIGMLHSFDLGPRWDEIWPDDHDTTFRLFASFDELQSGEQTVELLLNESSSYGALTGTSLETTEEVLEKRAKNWPKKKAESLLAFLTTIWKQLPDNQKPQIFLLPIPVPNEKTRVKWVATLTRDLSAKSAMQLNAGQILTFAEWQSGRVFDSFKENGLDKIDRLQDDTGGDLGSQCLAFELRNQERRQETQSRQSPNEQELTRRAESKKALLCREKNASWVFALSDIGWETESLWRTFSADSPKSKKSPLRKSKIGRVLNSPQKVSESENPETKLTQDWPPPWIEVYDCCASDRGDLQRLSIEMSQQALMRWKSELVAWLKKEW